MSGLYLLLVLAVLSCAFYYLGRSRSLQVAGGTAASLHSLPSYYGFYAAIWAVAPAAIVMLVWVALETTVIRIFVMGALPPLAETLSPDQTALLWTEIQNIASGNIVSAATNPDYEVMRREAAAHLSGLQGSSSLVMAAVVVALAVGGGVLGRSRVSADLRARNSVEAYVFVFLQVCSVIAILTTIGIIGSLIFESLRFFAQVSPIDFLFGTLWNPSAAGKAETSEELGAALGAVPLFVGTMLITAIAMTVAVPVGLLSAIYLSDYAGNRTRGYVKPLLEILAGVPTVVYGFFAALTVAPFIRNDIGVSLGIDISSESALAAGIVMGIMIIPFVSSLSDDVINAVPQSLRDGAYGLGATKSECIRNVVLPAALPGIFAAVLLAVSRAIGETMIVVMAAGLAGNLTINPLEAVTTVTVQIVKLLTGDTEFDTAKTLSSFALGLVLFIATLAMNVVALRVVQKYREKYD